MAGQVWEKNEYGGYFANPKLSSQVRFAAQTMQKFRQFVKPEPGFGAKQGETLLLDIVNDTDDDTGETPIKETEKTPETRAQITQTSVTVHEYGRKIPYTGKLESLSQYSPSDKFSVAIRNNMARGLDRVAAAAFMDTPLVMTPTGSVSAKTHTFSTTGTATATASRHIAWDDMIEIKAYLSQECCAPTYDGENFIGIGNSYTIAAMQKDPDWQEAKNYGDPASRFTGEIGKTNGIRWIEENNYFRGSGANKNYLGSGSYRGVGIVFGADAVVEAVAVAEELRADPPTDGGRFKSIQWYALLGMALVWSSTTKGHARAIKIQSL
jgi:N4-gp56 family major capsid protein